MLYLILISDTLINILLGKDWNGIILPFKLLAINYILYPINAIILNVMLVLGKSSLYLKYEIEKKIFGLILIIVVAFIEIKSILIIALINIFISIISLYINMQYLNFKNIFKYIELIKIITPPILISAIAYLTSLVYLNIGNKTIISLTISSIIYFSITSIIIYIVYKNIIKEIIYGIRK